MKWGDGMKRSRREILGTMGGLAISTAVWPGTLWLRIGGAAVAWPLPARAQQPDRMRRIGVLMAYGENDQEGQTWVAAFHGGLQKLGWTEGRNIQIDIIAGSS